MDKGRQSKSSRDGARHEPVMTWALRDDATRRAVYVGMLSPEENGLACRCICFSCGDRLRAINLGKSAAHFDLPRTQKKHFKHDSGADRRCLTTVARLLALRHYVEQSEVYLPPRRPTSSRLLPTGKVLDPAVGAPGSTVAVSRREWIDDQSALLVLEDGRQMVVTVRASHTVALDGASCSVLSFAGLDCPEVAGWTPEKILDHVRLPDWAAWCVHWDDARLEASAQDDLNRQEELLLGDIPREWLEGLSGLMASETVLHWLIKRAIQSEGKLTVPSFWQDVELTMPDGTVAVEQAHCPAQTLELKDVKFERRLGGIVPDVVCLARRSGSREPFYPLLVEAAVTHYVSEEKRSKILSAGLACIEIRADLFRQTGSVSVREIERVVRTEAAVKRWIAHPHIAREIESARAKLQAKAKGIRLRMDEIAARKRQEEVDRRSLEMWYREAPDIQLAKGYLKALRTVWTSRPLPSLGASKVDLNQLWHEVSRRCLATGSRGQLEAKWGPLHLIFEIQSCTAGEQTTLAVDLADDAFKTDGLGNAPTAVLAMYALKAYHPARVLEEDELYCSLKSQITSSLARGDAKFIRPTDFDPLLVLLFPEMAASLKTPFATQKARENRLAMLDAERERAERVAHRRRTRIQAVTIGRAAQERHRLSVQLADEIELVSAKVVWVRTVLGEDPASAGQLYGLFAGKVKLQQLDPMVAFKSAIEHKSSGKSVKAMLCALGLKSVSDVRVVIRLLQLARLCFVTDPSFPLE
jgi:hypothetical protein